MNSYNNQISLSKAALTAGFSTFIMVACAPFAEVYTYPKLVIAGNGAETVKNILIHQELFSGMMAAYVVTFTCDIVAAWALFILLRPVNAYLSALAGFFRLVFSVVAIMSLVNLATAFRIVTDQSYATLLKPDQLQAQVMLSLNNFRYGFHFGLIFFGFHLGLLGYLIWRSGFIPWVLGLFLIISGTGYFTTSLQPYLFPHVNLSLAVYTFYGELIFMFWLLVKGWRIKEVQ